MMDMMLGSNPLLIKLKGFHLFTPFLIYNAHSWAINELKVTLPFAHLLRSNAKRFKIFTI